MGGGIAPGVAEASDLVGCGGKLHSQLLHRAARQDITSALVLGSRHSVPPGIQPCKQGMFSTDTWFKTFTCQCRILGNTIYRGSTQTEAEAQHITDCHTESLTQTDTATQTISPQRTLTHTIIVIDHIC